ncbi:MAG: hypothetical protein R3175_08160 [Marinobacter sp.]|uniref:hypothetical protein n=1 Tax=Marinobacter sp. TaxID=50741 RepID=UPI00299EE3AD|nr:hypothetical protein [Marinobacter sp.]MDX1756014.1 hypothetical protein [Marinobacter sp.]
MALLLASCFVLSGCNGSSSSDKDDSSPAPTPSPQPEPEPEPETVSATFVDSSVSGLRYLCSSSDEVQLTDANGVLTCEIGDTVTFFVGSIELGSTVMEENTVFITPATLVGDNTNEATDAVLNMARLLISLDTDQDPSNGISLDESSHQDIGAVLEFDQTVENFEVSVASILTQLTDDLPDGPYTLVDADEAKGHLILGLFIQYAGLYDGTVDFGEATTRLTFVVSRQGMAYGVNETADGIYAQAASEVDPSNFDTLGVFEEFKIDGSTGATYYVPAEIRDGVLSGSDGDGRISFTATRELHFDPVIDEALVQQFSVLLPFAIHLDDSRTFVFSDDALAGFPFGMFEGGTPPSDNAANDPEYWDINVVEVVSTREDTVRLIAIAMNGLLLDISVDLSGETPAVLANWTHVHEGTEGTTTDFEANYALPK